MKTEPTSIGEILESALDGATMQDMMEAFRDICYGKEGHVLEAWQDGSLAREWQKWGDRFDKLAGKARESGHPSFAK